MIVINFFWYMIWLMFVFRNSQNTSEIPNLVLNNVAFYLFFIFCCLSVFFFLVTELIDLVFHLQDMKIKHWWIKYETRKNESSVKNKDVQCDLNFVTRSNKIYVFNLLALAYETLFSVLYFLKHYCSSPRNSDHNKRAGKLSREKK